MTRLKAGGGGDSGIWRPSAIFDFRPMSETKRGLQRTILNFFVWSSPTLDHYHEAKQVQSNLDLAVSTWLCTWAFLYVAMTLWSFAGWFDLVESWDFSCLLGSRLLLLPRHRARRESVEHEACAEQQWQDAQRGVCFCFVFFLPNEVDST